MPGLDIQKKYNYNLTDEGKIFAEEFNKVVDNISKPIDVTSSFNDNNNDRLLTAIDTLVKNTLFSTVKGVTIQYNRFDVHRVGMTTPIDASNIHEGTLISFITHATNPSSSTATQPTIRIDNGAYIPFTLPGNRIMPAGFIRPNRVYLLQYASGKFIIVNDDSHKADIDGNGNIRFKVDNPIDDTDAVNLRTLNQRLLTLDMSDFWILNEPNKSVIVGTAMNSPAGTEIEYKYEHDDVSPNNYNAGVIRVNSIKYTEDPGTKDALVVADDISMELSSGNAYGTTGRSTYIHDANTSNEGMPSVGGKVVGNMLNMTGTNGGVKTTYIGNDTNVRVYSPDSTGKVNFTKGNISVGNGSPIQSFIINDNQLFFTSGVQSQDVAVVKSYAYIGGSTVSKEGGGRPEISLFHGNFHGFYGDGLGSAKVYGVNLTSTHNSLVAGYTFIGSDGKGFAVGSGIPTVITTDGEYKLTGNEDGIRIIGSSGYSPLNVAIDKELDSYDGYAMKVNGKSIPYDIATGNEKTLVLTKNSVLESDSRHNSTELLMVGAHIMRSSDNSDIKINLAYSTVLGTNITSKAENVTYATLVGNRLKIIGESSINVTMVGNSIGCSTDIPGLQYNTVTSVGSFLLTGNDTEPADQPKVIKDVTLLGSRLLTSCYNADNGIVIGSSNIYNPGSQFNNSIKDSLVIGNRCFKQKTALDRSIVMNPNKMFSRNAIVTDSIIMSTSGYIDTDVTNYNRSIISVANLDLIGLNNVEDVTIIGTSIGGAFAGDQQDMVVVGNKIFLARKGDNHEAGVVFGNDLSVGIDKRAVVIGSKIGGNDVQSASSLYVTDSTVLGTNICVPTDNDTSVDQSVTNSTILGDNLVSRSQVVTDVVMMGRDLGNKLTGTVDDLMFVGKNLLTGSNMTTVDSMIIGKDIMTTDIACKLDTSILIGKDINLIAKTYSSTNFVIGSKINSVSNVMYSNTIMGANIGSTYNFNNQNYIGNVMVGSYITCYTGSYPADSSAMVSNNTIIGSSIVKYSNKLNFSTMLGNNLCTKSNFVGNKSIVIGSNTLTTAENLDDSVVITPYSGLKRIGNAVSCTVIGSDILTYGVYKAPLTRMIMIGQGIKALNGDVMTDSTIIGRDIDMVAGNNLVSNTIIGSNIKSKGTWGLQEVTMIGQDIEVGGVSTSRSIIMGSHIGKSAGGTDDIATSFVNCTVFGMNISDEKPINTDITPKFLNTVLVGRVAKGSFGMNNSLLMGSSVFDRTTYKGYSTIGIGVGVAEYAWKSNNNIFIGNSIGNNFSEVDLSVVIGQSILNTFDGTSSAITKTVCIGQNIANDNDQDETTTTSGSVLLGVDILNKSVSPLSVMIGVNTGNNSTGNGENTIIGRSTANYRTALEHSVVLGSDAAGIYAPQGSTPTLRPLTNVLVGGYKAGYETGLSNSTVLGTQAISDTSINMSGVTGLGHKIGMGAGDLSYCTIAGYFSAYGNSGAMYSSMYGYHAGRSIGSFSIAMGRRAGYLSSDGKHGIYSTFVGDEAGRGQVTGQKCTLLGFQAETNGTGDNQFILGGSNVSVLRCAVSTISALSDRRDKRNIVNTTGHLDVINKIKPREFEWDPRNERVVNMDNPDKQGKQLGFIAQELDDVCSESGTLGEILKKKGLVDTTNPERYEVGEAALIPVLVGAIQELSAEIAELKKQISNKG